jgi:hypothetical protein
MRRGKAEVILSAPTRGMVRIRSQGALRPDNRISISLNQQQREAQVIVTSIYVRIPWVAPDRRFDHRDRVFRPAGISFHRQPDPP